MGYFNKVMLMGNLTRDPELRTLPSDSKVVDFGLAASRRYKTSSGEEREEVLFVDCAAFGRSAEVIAQYCKKGRPLFIEGRLKYDTWEDRQNGQKRSKVSVVVENFQFISSREEADGAQSAGGREGQSASAGKARTPGKAEPRPEREDRGHKASPGQRRREPGQEEPASTLLDDPRYEDEDIPF